MIEEKYNKIAELAVNLVEGIKRTGLTVISLKDRYGKLLMPLQGNVNHVGMMYAGSLFTLGEVTGGIIPAVAFNITEFYPIVKEVNIKFVAPAMTDVTIECSISEEETKSVQDEADKNGKADFIMDMEIKDTNNKTVAVVKGTWQIRKIPEELKESLNFS